MAWRGGAPAFLALLALFLLPSAAQTQVFLATRPHPEFAVGPLFLRARVTPALGPVTVDLLWSLAIPPTRSALGLEQDLYLLWPGVVRDADEAGGTPGPGGGGAVDSDLARYVTSRGFTVLAEGRLSLLEEDLYPPAGAAADRRLGTVPFVTFARTGREPLGQVPTGSYVRIPWHASMVNRTRLVKLRLALDGLVQPVRATWFEEAVWGRRQRLTLGFNDVREPAVFPLYVENRTRLLRLAHEPSQLLVAFAGADRLRIDEVSPRPAGRKPSQGEANTEVVSLFLDSSEGAGPQELTVRFGYTSAWQGWLPVAVPLLFFVLGRATGPLIERAARWAGRAVASRLQVGSGAGEGRAEGVLLSRETLARLVPGQTTAAEVQRLCGAEVTEEREALAAPGTRTLVYRGRRVLPRTRRRLGWVTTLSRWEAEEQTVDIVLERDVVQDVQVSIRRTRLPGPDAA